MAPTIITRHGKPVLAVGSPGGSMIITTVLQVLLERLELGKSLPEAVAAPRVSQRNTATSLGEPAFLDSPDARRAGGRAVRPAVRPAAARSAPSPAIEFLPTDRFLAAAEPVRRGGGSAMVVKDR